MGGNSLKTTIHRNGLYATLFCEFFAGQSPDSALAGGALALHRGQRQEEPHTLILEHEEPQKLRNFNGDFGAEEGTRTPTPLRVHGPEPCASANSATSARERLLRRDSTERAAILSLANALRGVKFSGHSPAMPLSARPTMPAVQPALHPGVFTPFFSIVTAFAIRFCRVSSFFASSIHLTYSLRCV